MIKNVKSVQYQKLHSKAHGSGILVIPPLPNPIRGSTTTKKYKQYVQIQILRTPSHCQHTSASTGLTPASQPHKRIKYCVQIQVQHTTTHCHTTQVEKKLQVY